MWVEKAYASVIVNVTDKSTSHDFSLNLPDEVNLDFI